MIRLSYMYVHRLKSNSVVIPLSKYPQSCFTCRATLQRDNTENLNSNQIYSQSCLSPNFHIHVSVSDLQYIFPRRSDCLFRCRKICGPILGIYKSLTDTRLWKLGLRQRSSFSGKTWIGFSLQCGYWQLEGSSQTDKIWFVASWSLRDVRSLHFLCSNFSAPLCRLLWLT